MTTPTQKFDSPGSACAVNAAIYKSSLALPAKTILNIVTGSAAFVLWLGIVLATQVW